MAANVGCPTPFLNEADFPPSGGHIGGRLCAPIAANASCCLTCPTLDWFYTEDFYPHTRIPGYLALGSIGLSLFMSLSFAMLPATKTKRHYLNGSLVASILLLELGIAVPVLKKPDRCNNLITPNDQDSSMTCAWSGALLIFGFASANLWVLVRAITTNLLVVWNVNLSWHALWMSHLVAWGVSAIITAVSFARTGVSFRIGDYCLLNAYNSFATLWYPLLGFACVTTFFTLGTTGYCLFVYITKDSGRPSNARNFIWQRVNAVAVLQWRAILLTIIMLIDLIVSCVVFQYANSVTITAQQDSSANKYEPWLLCLVQHPNNKDPCLRYVDSDVPNQTTLVATMALDAVLGIIAFIVLTTPGMLTGWIDLIKVPKLDMGRKRDPQKADISKPQLQRNSLSTTPMSNHELPHLKIATSGKFLKMGTRPVDSLRLPLSEHRAAQDKMGSLDSNGGKDLAMTTSKELKTPQKRVSSHTPSRMSIGEWDPTKAERIGPLNFHPINVEEEEEEQEDHDYDHDNGDIWELDTPDKSKNV